MPRPKARRAGTLAPSHEDDDEDNARENSVDGEETSALQQPTKSSQDSLRILIATDNHLGFLEKDPTRGDDSFRTFDEILTHAADRGCDATVLGGDLFHLNKPSRNTMFKTQKILKKHVFGNRPVQIRVVSDQRAAFGGRVVNYEDPSLCVHMPIFMIHGNHDDPTREGTDAPLSAIDLLAEAGLVNYFGRSPAEEIRIEPVLIVKNDIKLALYGLGWIRDERLHRTFNNKKVTFVQPAESTNEWINVFVVHQNRDKGMGKNCVAEAMIPNFIDLVIWGHEHECQIIPTQKSKWMLSQPGSSIAVSLVDAEAVQKHCAVLEIKRNDEGDSNFRMVPVPLKTVRPFIFKGDVVLSKVKTGDFDVPEAEKAEAVNAYLTRLCKQLLAEYEPRAPLPLMRVRVENTGFPDINLSRFQNQFSFSVANPGEMLLFYKANRFNLANANHHLNKKASKGGWDVAGHEDGESDPLLPHEGEGLDAAASEYETPVDRIAHLTRITLRESAGKLEILLAPLIQEAVDEYVQKDTTSAIASFVEARIEAAQRILRRERHAAAQAAAAAAGDGSKASFSAAATSMDKGKLLEILERNGAFDVNKELAESAKRKAAETAKPAKRATPTQRDSEDEEEEAPKSKKPAEPAKRGRAAAGVASKLKPPAPKKTKKPSDSDAASSSSEEDDESSDSDGSAASALQAKSAAKKRVVAPVKKPGLEIKPPAAPSRKRVLPAPAPARARKSARTVESAEEDDGNRTEDD